MRQGRPWDGIHPASVAGRAAPPLPGDADRGGFAWAVPVVANARPAGTGTGARFAGGTPPGSAAGQVFGAP